MMENMKNEENSKRKEITNFKIQKEPTEQF